MNKLNITLILILCLLSFGLGYKYNEKPPIKPVVVKDTITKVLPGARDTIFIKQKADVVTVYKEKVDSSKIEGLLFEISKLENELLGYKIQRIAILDTIMPLYQDRIYVEYDELSNLFLKAQIDYNIRRVPIEIKTIYMPYKLEKKGLEKLLEDPYITMPTALIGGFILGRL